MDLDRLEGASDCSALSNIGKFCLSGNDWVVGWWGITKVGRTCTTKYVHTIWMKDILDTIGCLVEMVMEFCFVFDGYWFGSLLY